MILIQKIFYIGLITLSVFLSSLVSTYCIFNNINIFKSYLYILSISLITIFISYFSWTKLFKLYEYDFWMLGLIGTPFISLAFLLSDYVIVKELPSKIKMIAIGLNILILLLVNIIDKK